MRCGDLALAPFTVPSPLSGVWEPPTSKFVSAGDCALGSRMVAQKTQRFILVRAMSPTSSSVLRVTMLENGRSTRCARESCVLKPWRVWCVSVYVCVFGSLSWSHLLTHGNGASFYRWRRTQSLHRKFRQIQMGKYKTRPDLPPDLRLS